MGVSSMGHGPCTLKETDLTRALRAPEKAGVSVARAEVSRDGTIVLVLNRAGETLPNSKRNEWDEDVARSSASGHSTKGGMRRLAEADGTAHELMAFLGHKTPTKVQYTTDADRKRLDVDMLMSPELQAACDAMPKVHLTYIITTHGKARSKYGLGNDFTKWVTEADTHWVY